VIYWVKKDVRSDSHEKKRSDSHEKKRSDSHEKKIGVGMVNTPLYVIRFNPQNWGLMVVTPTN